jgi:hypothetical protein
MTDALVTQVSLEEFVTTNPDARVTIAGIEHWISTGTVTCQALATMVAVEEWIRVESATVARQYAVTVT